MAWPGPYILFFNPLSTFLLGLPKQYLALYHFYTSSHHQLQLYALTMRLSTILAILSLSSPISALAAPKSLSQDGGLELFGKEKDCQCSAMGGTVPFSKIPISAYS